MTAKIFGLRLVPAWILNSLKSIIPSASSPIGSEGPGHQTCIIHDKFSLLAMLMLTSGGSRPGTIIKRVQYDN